GLSGHEGNHGEDAKDYWWFLDNVPSHAYMRALYKYPQCAFPYARLVEENARRGRDDPEFELLDAGVFDDDRYFDVTVEYAKASPTDLLVRITAVNRGPEPAPLELLPTLWFRNTWSWGQEPRKPVLARADDIEGAGVIEFEHHYYHRRWLSCEGSPTLLFTENETNFERLFGLPNASP